jgi:4-aminobutyrate aminotransferase
MRTAEAIIQMKQDYFFPNAMHFYKNPPVIVRGEDQYLFDTEGKRYLDFFAGVTVVNCGHCNPVINAKVEKQLNTLQHTSIIYLTEPMVNLAGRLAEVLPGDMKQTFFCCSGTEANEGAMLLARLHTGKKGFIAFEGGLHGRSALTMSVTGIPMWRIDPFPDPEVYFAKGFMANESNLIETAEISLNSVEDILNKHGHEIAACMIEPVQGNGGIHVPPMDFFKKLKALLEAHGVLLIADEVQTGFARTGKMFAMEHFNVVPDLMTMAKALGNGVPIGAFSARPEIATSFNKPSASTLGGNPVSATAGLAVLDYIRDFHLCEHSEVLGRHFLARLKSIKARHHVVQDVRGLGLMLGMTLENGEQVDLVLEHMKDAGYIIGKNGMDRNVLAFQPPLTIKETDVDLMCLQLDQVLALL